MNARKTLMWMMAAAIVVTVRPAVAEDPPGMTRSRSESFNMASRWQKATDLMGKKVTNDANEDLGKLEDIVVDANSGRILYGVLSFGGFLGMGDKLFAIPWQSLNLSGDYKQFTLNVAKDRLKSAEGFDKDKWPNFADEKWATTTYKYYDQPPYWTTPTASPPATGLQTRSDYQDRWNQRASNWQKASDLCGKDIRNPKDENLGTIKDIAIDPDNARLMYGILSFRGKLFAIPWNALSMSPESKHFVLHVDKETLKDTVAFTDDRYPNFVDARWANDIHAHYHVEPYWVVQP